MPSVNVKNIVLNQTSVMGSKKPEVVANACAIRYKRDIETKLPTEEIDGYSVNVLSARGEVQTVKLPEKSASVIEKIKEALADDMVVKVTFTGFKGRFWAMLRDGHIVQGISCNADSVEISAIEQLADDDIDIDM